MQYLSKTLAALAVVSSTLGGPFTAGAQEAPHAHHHGSPAGLDDTERAYLAETEAAMAKMMSDMESQPTGDVDRDFVAMMLPHHQGAIEMAVAVLRHGKNERLKRIAQEIIVEQQQEISAMKIAIGEPLSPSAPVPTQQSKDPSTSGMAAGTPMQKQ